MNIIIIKLYLLKNIVKTLDEKRVKEEKRGVVWKKIKIVYYRGRVDGFFEGILRPVMLVAKEQASYQILCFLMMLVTHFYVVYVIIYYSSLTTTSFSLLLDTHLGSFTTDYIWF